MSTIVRLENIALHFPRQRGILTGILDLFRGKMTAGKGKFTALQNVDLEAGTLDIYMVNDEPLAGFQISFTGIDITGASGGSSEDAGFMVSSSENMVLGFSLAGTSIPAGEGVLATISFTTSVFISTEINKL